MCGSTKNVDAATADQKAFTATMAAQGTQVFGADNTVFNDLMNSYKSTVAAGPSQQGWSATETNAVNSQIINNAAVANRNIQAAVGNNISAIQGRGGAGTAGPAGSSAALEASVAESVEAQKSTALNQATQENYAQGNKNYEFATEGMSKAPSVFNNMPGMNAATQKGMDANMANAQAADAASNWWVKPVMGLAGDAISIGEDFAIGGLSGPMKSASTSSPSNSSSSGDGGGFMGEEW